MIGVQIRESHRTQTKRQILKSAQKQKMILKVAVECFSRRGLSKTSLADIATEANMGSSHILYHFKNTDEIFVELIKKMFQEARERSKTYSQKARGPEEKLEAYVHAMFDWVFSNKNYQRLFLLFQSESLYIQELIQIRRQTHQGAIDFLSYLLKDKNKALIAQNLLTGALIDFCLDPIQNVNIREQTKNHILEMLWEV